jgi:hypothetical protein
MGATCQTDADVGASDIERPVAPICLTEICGLCSCVSASSLPIFEAGRVADDRL